MQDMLSRFHGEWVLERMPPMRRSTPQHSATKHSHADPHAKQNVEEQHASVVQDALAQWGGTRVALTQDILPKRKLLRICPVAHIGVISYHDEHETDMQYPQASIVYRAWGWIDRRPAWGLATAFERVCMNHLALLAPASCIQYSQRCCYICIGC